MDKTYCDNWCNTTDCEHHFSNVKDIIGMENIPVWFYISKPLDCEKWTPRKN